MFTNVNLFWMSILFRDGVTARPLAFTFVNGKTSVSALGVNMLTRIRFSKIVVTPPLAGYLLTTMNRILHEYSRTPISDSERGTS